MVKVVVYTEEEFANIVELLEDKVQAWCDGFSSGANQYGAGGVEFYAKVDGIIVDLWGDDIEKERLEELKEILEKEEKK